MIIKILNKFEVFIFTGLSIIKLYSKLEIYFIVNINSTTFLSALYYI
jgi:hypothetical protein